jgi:hypothetical protein
LGSELPEGHGTARQQRPRGLDPHRKGSGSQPGREDGAEAASEHNAKARAQQKARRKAARDRAPTDVDEPDQDVARDWKEELLDALLAMPPAGFERLAQRLLREAGFISAT